MNEVYKYKIVYALQFKRDFKTLNSTEQSETEEII